METLCEKNFQTIKKGLFVPPDIEEAFIDLNDLEVRVEGEKGGYILWSMEKMISAELSFSPIDSKNYLRDIEMCFKRY